MWFYDDNSFFTSLSITFVMNVTSTVKEVRKNVSFGKIDTAFLILDTPDSSTNANVSIRF